MLITPWIPSSLLGAVLAIGCGGSLQDTEGITDASEDQGISEVQVLLDGLTRDYVDVSGSQGKAIGLVVGVATPQGRYVTGFGATELNGDTPPDANSIFDIASLSKVYTGYLLASGINKGEVSLGDVLNDSFDAVPTFQGQEIELLDLATHTSGLPNYPDNLIASGPNPTAGYTPELLEAFLASYTLTVAPGDTYKYSNLASGLLGHILVVASGEPNFEALLQRGIAEPYGLTDTMVMPNTSQQSRKLQGYSNGSPAPALEIGGPLQGGGAVRSTGNEVLRFIEGAISDNDSVWDQVLTPRRNSPHGVNSRTGFLLNIENPGGPEIFSKNGGAPGFSSQIVFTLEPPAAVVLLSNSSDTSGMYDLGKTILQELITLPGF